MEILRFLETEKLDYDEFVMPVTGLKSKRLH